MDQDTQTQLAAHAALSDREILVKLRMDVAVLKSQLDGIPGRVGALERWKAWALGLGVGSGTLGGYEVWKWLGCIFLASFQP